MRGIAALIAPPDSPLVRQHCARECPHAIPPHAPAFAFASTPSSSPSPSLSLLPPLQVDGWTRSRSEQRFGSSFARLWDPHALQRLRTRSILSKFFDQRTFQERDIQRTRQRNTKLERRHRRTLLRRARRRSQILSRASSPLLKAVRVDSRHFPLTFMIVERAWFEPQHRRVLRTRAWSEV
jgi:hypothetical protein